jgi:hypothetical protein
MAEPSPAAEAVLNAITLKRWDVPYQACGQSLEQIQEDVTATLRAVANRLSDEVIVTSEDFKGVTQSELLVVYVSDLLSLADEIEAM